MQNKEICGEKSVNEKNLEVFNRYFPGCLSVENDNKLTLDVGRLKALLGVVNGVKNYQYRELLWNRQDKRHIFKFFTSKQLSFIRSKWGF